MPNRTRHSKRRRPLPPVRQPSPDPVAAPDLHELEKFTHRDLRRWQAASDKLNLLHSELYFGLESQRVGARLELLASLRAKPAAQFDFGNWIRIVDYRYCLEPLSPAGSLRGIGGRFNIGQDLTLAGFASSPALYLAEDFGTAYREKFQCPPGLHGSGLSASELALHSKAGFLVANLQGRIASVFDAQDPESLRPFCNLIAKFAMPRKVRELSKALHAIQPQLVRSPSLLQRAIFSTRWRAVPAQFEFPATSQVFGSLVKDAGYEAILYKSSKNAKRCMAIFPEQIKESDSFIELAGDYPVEIVVHRLDQASWPTVKQSLSM